MVAFSIAISNEVFPNSFIANLSAPYLINFIFKSIILRGLFPWAAVWINEIINEIPIELTTKIFPFPWIGGLFLGFITASGIWDY